MKNCCEDYGDCGEYFSVNWVHVWPDGTIDEGSIGTDRNVDTFEDFIEWVLRPMCRSVGFTDKTIYDYIEETW